MGRDKPVRQLKPVVIVIALIAVLTVSTIGIAVYMIVLGDTDSTSEVAGEVLDDKEYTDPTTGLSIVYPGDLTKSSNHDPIDGILFTLAKDDPRLQLTAWVEEGESISKLGVLNQPLNQVMLLNAKRQLPRTYPGQRILGERVFNLNGIPAAELTFDYDANYGSKATQRLVILVKDSDTVVSIGAQSTSSDFALVNESLFEPMFDSLQFQTRRN